jgi:uncharacterized protein involved in outer membrane biogenesis
MPSSKIFVFLFRALVLPVTLIVILIGILSYAQISVPLESVRNLFVQKATGVAGREVQVDGEVRLAISFYPTLVVDQLHITNEPQWSAEDILSVGETRVQLALLPIFSGQLEFIEISASTIQLNLEQDSDGSQNWASLLPPESSSDKDPSTPRSKDNIDKKFWIEEFRLTDLNINYLDEHLGRSFSNRIDRLVINTHDKANLTADIEGSSNDIPYSFAVTADLFRNLISNKPWQMELQGKLSEKPVNLEIQIEPSNKTIDGSVRFNVQEVDIGQTLSWLGLVEGLDAYSSNLTFNADLQGGNLKEILEQSVFKLDLDEGHWNLQNPANDKSRKITFSTATLLAEPENPVKLELTGKIDDEPTQLELSSNRMSEFFTNLEKVHLDLTATLEHSTINLTGNIDLPISNQTLIVDLEVKGKRLDHWNKMLETDIPPFGPYHFSGKFSVDPKGFRVSNLKTIIGDSDLGGQVFVDTSGSETHWDLNLISQNFQINDFEVEGFSLFADTTDSEIGEIAPLGRKEKGKLAQKSLSKEFKNSHSYPGIDVTLKLEAGKVLSGEDDLGGGKLHLIATDSSLNVKSFELDIPGGAINGSLNLEQQKEETKGYIKLDMDKFDYGILYRYFKPDSPADGLLSARVNLQLAGSDFSQSLDNASGELDFALWPKNIDAKVLNIWSVNLFLALLPELNKKESKLNCAVALLDLKDGKLFEELLLVDSSKIWMNGNLNVDFQKETVSLSLFPKAKKARLFGLQAPIRVKGSFNELNLKIKPFDLLSSYVSFITSPLHAPFQRTFGKKIPDDGSELCGQLLDREYLKAVLKEMEKRTPTLDEMYDYD